MATIDYTESFRLFPENWGDINQNIGTNPELSLKLFEDSPESTRSSASFWRSCHIGMLSENKIVTIKATDRNSQMNSPDYQPNL